MVCLKRNNREPITGPVSPDIKGCNSPTDIIVRETLILGKFKGA